MSSERKADASAFNPTGRTTFRSAQGRDCWSNSHNRSWLQLGRLRLRLDVGGTAEQKAKDAGEAAIVRVLAPICADKFRQASDSAAKLTALKGTDSWKRDDFIKDTGYATFPGSEYDRKVADACVELLTQVKG